MLGLETELDSYEYVYKPIPDNVRKRNSLLIAILTLSLSGYITYLLFKINTYSSVDSLFWLFPVTIFSGGIYLSWRAWQKKVKKMLSPESLISLKSKQEEFETKWYFRYFFSLIFLAVSYASFVAYIDDTRISGLALLVVNPISGILFCILALISGWEIALAVTIGVVLYYLFLGVAALPVSLAIILGAIIIAAVICRRKT